MEIKNCWLISIKTIFIAIESKFNDVWASMNEEFLMRAILTASNLHHTFWAQCTLDWDVSQQIMFVDRDVFWYNQYLCSIR